MVTDALDHGANVNAVTRTSDSGNTALHIITSVGRPADNAKLLPIVTLLISRGANPNIQNRDGTTPLMLATLSKNIETMKLLLDAGADVTIEHHSGQTAVYMARDLQFVDGVTLLEGRQAAAPAPAPANPDQDARLERAAFDQSIAEVTAALDAGANVNHVGHDSGYTPLTTAIHYPDGNSTVLPIIRLLIDRGADVNMPNYRGDAPLHVAAHFNNVPVIDILLEAGADVHVRTHGGFTPREVARQLLNYAAATRLEAAETANPAPLSAVSSAVVPETPPAQVSESEQDRALEAAVTANDDAAAQAAILAGANPNMMLYGDRETVLIHYAATENRPMVEFLLAHGADVNGRAGPGADEPGWTALNYTRNMDIGEFIEERGGMTARLLDYGPAAASQINLSPASSPEQISRPVLSGRSDLKIPPIWVRDDYRSAMTEGVDWEVIDIPEIFVAKLGRDLTLDQFFRKYMGDGIVFKVGAKFYGVERKDLMQEYSEGSAIAYECRKTFPYSPNAVPPVYGTFEYSDIYATPYFALRTPAGVFYTDFLGAVDMLSRPHAFYKVGTNPVKKLENVASRSSVLAGGPVVSQLHCQAGSGENVYEISPFRLPEIKDDEKEEEEEEPNVVYVKKGEDKTEFPLDLSQTVLQLKEAVKEKLGIAVESQKFIFQGKVMKNEQTLGEAKVGKGYTIQLQTIGGRRFTRKYCKKTACKKMGFTQKASCRPYKNCYRSTAGVHKKRRTYKRRSRK